MSEKQMEKNLEYGDCFNFFGALSSLLVGTIESIKNTAEKNLEKIRK